MSINNLTDVNTHPIIHPNGADDGIDYKESDDNVTADTQKTWSSMTVKEQKEAWRSMSDAEQSETWDSLSSDQQQRVWNLRIPTHDDKKDIW